MDVRLIFILIISHLGFSQETVNNNNADVGNCRIIPENPSAIAIAKYNGVTQIIVSCVNNVEQGKYDVHVLGIYKGYVHSRLGSPGTINVYIKGESSKPVVLVLTSYEPVKWVIHSDSHVKVHAVQMFSYYHTISSVDVSDVDNSGSVIIEKASISSATGDSGGDDTVRFLKYLDSRWGSVKSVSGCYRADEWTVKVSKVEEEPKVANCLNSKDCWVQHNFQFEDNWNDCHGKQYVRKTTYKVGKYVGVVLCSSTRYKLFLSDSLSDRFLNIGDGSGHGQDHCEFIGSKNDSTSIDSNFWDSPRTTGYIRSRRGETPAKGRIGGGTGSSWTGKYYGKWIECGVRIPGNSRVALSSDAKVDVGNCRIIPDNPSAIAIAKYNGVTQKVRSCVNNVNQGKYDVHVLGHYKGYVHTRPASAGTTNVYIKGESSKPVVLVLSSYEPVKWVIRCESRVKMRAVQMFSYYHTISSVDVSHVNNSSSVMIEKTRRASATGDDSRGGDTVGLLKYVDSRWGSVNSFSECYRADEWTLKVSKVEEEPKDAEVQQTTQLSIPKTPTTPTTRCMRTYCSGSYTIGAKCVNGYCVCTKTGYNYYTCLPDYAGCLVQRNKETRALPFYHGRRAWSEYSCINKSSLNLSPEVHVLGCHENIVQRPPKAGTTTLDIVGHTTKPAVLVLTSYEPVAWRINVPAGITIQKIMLYSYYLDKSSVSVSGGSNPPVEKSRKRVYGYGNDIGYGSHTLKLLAEVKKLFGHVTSFSGSYKVDEWSLTVGI